jgi:hypothetical protein
MMDFGYRTTAAAAAASLLLASNRLKNNVDETLSWLKMDVLLWNDNIEKSKTQWPQNAWNTTTTTTAANKKNEYAHTRYAAVRAKESAVRSSSSPSSIINPSSSSPLKIFADTHTEDHAWRNHTGFCDLGNCEYGMARQISSLVTAGCFGDVMLNQSPPPRSVCLP